MGSSGVLSLEELWIKSSRLKITILYNGRIIRCTIDKKEPNHILAQVYCLAHRLARMGFRETPFITKVVILAIPMPTFLIGSHDKAHPLTAKCFSQTRPRK
uniref:Uncharacterized protein n=1 Tax=Lotharella globosa TaxID=91324 RepID=A0A7S3ZIN3_9EUKA